MGLYSVKTSESLFGTEPFSVLLFEKISGQPGCLTPWPGLEGHYWPRFAWEGRSRGCGSPGPSRHVQTVVGWTPVPSAACPGQAPTTLFCLLFFFFRCLSGYLEPWAVNRVTWWPEPTLAMFQLTAEPQGQAGLHGRWHGAAPAPTDHQQLPRERPGLRGTNQHQVP